MAKDLGTVMGGPVVAIHPRSAGLLNNAAKRPVGLPDRPTEGPNSQTNGLPPRCIGHPEARYELGPCQIERPQSHTKHGSASDTACKAPP